MPRKATLSLEDTGPALDPAEGAVQVLRQRQRKLGQQTKENPRTMSLLAWSVLVPEKRGPLDFERFAYQREWYDDRSAFDREQVDMKANQVGDSTKSIRLAMFHADRGRTVLYVMPTQAMLSKFSQRRIAPIIRGSDYLAQRVAGDAINNVAQRQIGWGWIEARGADVPIEEVDADLMVVDEYDFCDQNNIEESERRVTGPMSAGLIRRLSIPTIPNYGIAKAYAESDQRIWTVKCGACGHWNGIYGYKAFERNVDKDTKRMVCSKTECRKPLDLRAGEWVATYPGREVRGHHTPKLVVPDLDLTTVIANSKKRAPLARQAFFRRDLGQPWAPEEGHLSPQAVQRCVREELTPQYQLKTHRPVTMGVDQASSRPLNVVIEEEIDEVRTRLVWAGDVEDVPGGGSAMTRLVRLMDAYSVVMAGIDNGPDGRFAREFQGRCPGRVWRLGYFNPAPNPRTEPPPWNINEEERFTSLWRLKAIDAVFERFRNEQVLLPPLELLPEEYPAELSSTYRQVEEVPGGGVRAFYVKTGPDDYVHAHVYSLAASELFHREAGIKQVTGQGPEPLQTGGGYNETDLGWSSEPEYRPGPDDNFG